MSINLRLTSVAGCPWSVGQHFQVVEIVEVIKTVQIARQSFLLSKSAIRNPKFFSPSRPTSRLARLADKWCLVLTS
jgi:hypothetical protein